MSLTCSQATTGTEVISATGLDPESDDPVHKTQGLFL